MRIAIIGATGLLGTGMVVEATGRGHAVTAICRRPESLAPLTGVNARACNVFDGARLTESLLGHDAVIHSYSPRRDYETNRIAPHVAATRAILSAVRDAGIGRLLCAGGAGSLLLPDGTKMMDASGFPSEYKESAISTARILDVVRAEAADLQWTFLCPSLFFEEWGRTGIFRIGGDHALFARTGRSSISIEDFAIAMIDELEKPRHTHRRFTVGY